MTKTAEQVLQQAMELDPAERREVVERLLETDDSRGISTDPEYIAAWEAEIKRRIDQIDRGEGTSFSVEEALRMVKQGCVPDGVED